MRARVPDAPDAGRPPDRPKQLGEEGPAPGEVPAVGVHVLAEEGHLGYSPVSQGPDFVDDPVEGAADLWAAHLRHDAEGAGVVAAHLDGDPRRVRALPHRLERRGRRPGRVRFVENLHHRPLGGRPAQQLRCPLEVVGPEDHVHVRRAPANEVAVLLGQAPPDGDLHVRAAGGQGLHVAELAVETVVGVLPDAARVEHENVRFGRVVCRFESVGRQQAGDALRIVLVHLAPEGPDVERTRHPPKCTGRPGRPEVAGSRPG